MSRNIYNRKIVFALREPYNGEDMYSYFQVPYNRKTKLYVVLEELEDKLLVVRLKYLEKQDSLKYALFRENYPSLTREATIPDGNISVIPKDNVIAIISDIVSEFDFRKVVLSLYNTSGFYLEESARSTFIDFRNRYYKNELKIGTVVTILNKDNSFSLYYVKEVLDDSFVGIVLHYDPSTGLSASDEERVVSFDSRFEQFDYSDEYKAKVDNLIHVHKLKLIESN